MHLLYVFQYFHNINIRFETVFFLNHILTKAELSYKIYYQIQNNAQHVYNNYINMSQAEKKAYELWPGKNKFYLKGKIMLG